MKHFKRECNKFREGIFLTNCNAFHQIHYYSSNFSLLNFSVEYCNRKHDPVVYIITILLLFVLANSSVDERSRLYSITELKDIHVISNEKTNAEHSLSADISDDLGMHCHVLFICISLTAVYVLY